MLYIGMALGGILGSLMTMIFLEIIRALINEKELGKISLEIIK